MFVLPMAHTYTYYPDKKKKHITLTCRMTCNFTPEINKISIHLFEFDVIYTVFLIYGTLFYKRLNNKEHMWVQIIITRKVPMRTCNLVSKFDLRVKKGWSPESSIGIYGRRKKYLLVKLLGFSAAGLNSCSRYMSTCKCLKSWTNLQLVRRCSNGVFSEFN